ncbi:MAG: hypothetical protein V7740_16095 [Pseudomonas marincola]
MTTEPTKEVPNHLAEYLSNNVPRRGFSVCLDTNQLAHIGSVIVQWSQLEQQFGFFINMTKAQPAVPAELRSKDIGQGAERQLKHARKVGKVAYKNKRDGNASTELERIIAEIMELKGVRDALAHGTFAKNNNANSNAITVHHKSENKTYSLDEIADTGQRIGECTSAMLEFHMWADIDIHLELHRKLTEMIEAD